MAAGHSGGDPISAGAAAVPASTRPARASPTPVITDVAPITRWPDAVPPSAALLPRPPMSITHRVPTDTSGAMPPGSRPALAAPAASFPCTTAVLPVMGPPTALQSFTVVLPNSIAGVVPTAALVAITLPAFAVPPTDVPATAALPVLAPTTAPTVIAVRPTLATPMMPVTAVAPTSALVITATRPAPVPDMPVGAVLPATADPSAPMSAATETPGVGHRQNPRENAQYNSASGNDRL